MPPVRPRITEHVGVRVMRSKSESLFGAFVNIPRLVQLNRRARLLSDRPERTKDTPVIRWAEHPMLWWALLATTRMGTGWVSCRDD